MEADPPTNKAARRIAEKLARARKRLNELLAEEKRLEQEYERNFVRYAREFAPEIVTKFDEWRAQRDEQKGRKGTQRQSTHANRAPSPVPLKPPETTPPARALVLAPDEARFRTEAPIWCDGRYDYDCLKRRDGEGDADYFYRMWHTEPPWAHEYKPKAQETDVAFARRCWMQKSPEERAEHRASLPPTAR